MTLSTDGKTITLPDSTTAQIEGKKVVITRDLRGMHYTVEQKADGRPFSIEYKDVKLEQTDRIMDDKVKELVDKTYVMVGNITSNALANISHNKAGRLSEVSDTFVKQIKEGSYSAAKATIIAMLPEMDKYINKNQVQAGKVNFSSLISDIEDLESPKLDQFLHSFENVFARNAGVQTKNEKYSFQYGEKAVDMNTLLVGGRDKEIRQAVNYITDTYVKDAYLALINKAAEYRTANPNTYAQKTVSTTTLTNAMGINLGNRLNPERLLLNPQVISL
ncbi:MAG: hypothetical protein LBU27_09075 [Candidatus Peribacteria bacterium]|jgi:sulfur relay (sulfurtransferase) DsrF/TusC family protein|nr:hypothetical protein [Candidatus Peribacteria bacterium]